MDGMGYIFVYKHRTVSHLKQRGIEHTGGATEDGKNPFRCSVCWMFLVLTRGGR